MEENMERRENELQNEQQEVVSEEIVSETPVTSEEAVSPKKPPMNKKLMIGIIAGAAAAVIAIVVALILILGGGHTCEFGEWTVTSEATCTATGLKERVCSCGEKETEEIPAIGHDWKEATCQGPKLCKNCRTVEGEAGDHAYTESIPTADALKSKATCASAAVYYKSCICGEISDDDDDTFTSGTTTAHSYAKTASTEADCEHAATETYACSCGDTYTDTIGDALGHNTIGVTPVEKQSGGSSCEYVWVYTCKECGKEVEGEKISRHNYIASITTPATCKADGVKTISCTVCNNSYTEVIEKNSTGHNWIKGTAANGVRTDRCEHCSETKTVTVYSGTQTGSINSDSLKDTEIELNNTSITLDNGVIDSIGDKSVTISADKVSGNPAGLSPEQMEQIGDIYDFSISDGTGNISQFGEGNYVTITLPYELSPGEDVDSIAIWFINDDGEVEAIKATYNNGYVTFKTNHFSYYTVTRLSAKQRCDLYGHSYTEQTYAGSCTADGYILKLCVRCHDSVKTITHTATGHDYNTEVHAAGCTENGYTLYSCKNCSYAYRKTENAVGHVWESISKDESTCTVNGKETFGCKNCDAEYTETLPKSEHQMVEEELVKEATCSEKGSKIILCVCGETVYVDIPATGDHDYKNGVCSVCGKRNANAITLDSIVIRTDNLSYTWSEKIDNEWVIGGKIEQIELAELMLYIEDGELQGAATGTVDYYTKYTDTTVTYSLKAIIEGDYLYYHIDDIQGSLKRDIEGKVSVSELILSRFTPSETVSKEMEAFFKDTLLPVIELLAENNIDVAEEILDKAINIIFTTEEEADGTRIISLDYNKVNALSENLYTLTVAEVIDLYFGEGTVDELYSLSIELLNTKFTDIPGILEKQGINAEELLDSFESFCDKTGLALGVDLNDVLYGDEYADITFGMLIFGTEDSSYDEYVDQMLDLIKEKTLYDLITPEHQDDAKELVDGIIEILNGKALISLTINPAGQLVEIEVEAKELNFEYDDESHKLNGSITISIGDKIEVTWGDIADKIEKNIIIPEEMKEEDVEIDNFHTSGTIVYKDKYYRFEGMGYREYMADYSSILMYQSSYDCGDYRYYNYAFNTIGFSISYGNIHATDGSDDSYYIVRDDLSGEIVELQIKDDGSAIAVYEDGSQKTLTADELSDPKKLAKAVFGAVMQDNFFSYDYINFYYNAKTDEVSEESPHDYEYTYELEGDSCEDGVVITRTCKYCGDVYSYHTTDHSTYPLEKIDLAALGSVCGGYATVRGCACGYNYHIDINDYHYSGSDVNCDFSTHGCPLWVENAIDYGYQWSADGEQWFGSNSYVYVCSVTHPEQCGFKVRYASYWVKEAGCTASYYEVWQFGYNEDTGTFAREIKVKSESTRVYHNYVSSDISTSTASGRKYTCTDCGSWYSEITYYNSNGNQTKFERYAENKLSIGNRSYQYTQTFGLDGNSNQTQTNYTKYVHRDGSISEDIYEYMYRNGDSYTKYSLHTSGDYWYRYDYTYDFTGECRATEVRTDSDGYSWSNSYNCCRTENSIIDYPTCSQSGLEGSHCRVCGKQNYTYEVEPYDHSWQYHNGSYYCTRCGLENINGSSGSVTLEDLTYRYGNGTHYVVGYYTRNVVNFTHYVSFMLPDGREIVLEGIGFTEMDDPRAIKFSKAAVKNALAKLGYSMSDGHVRFAFVPFDDSGELDYAITFTEQPDIDNITGDISFVQYVEARESITFNPTKTGYWRFTSLSDYYSYMTVLDSDGYEINWNWGWCYSTDCYLEAGETYTIDVYWDDASRSGVMSFIFEFIEY